MKRVTQALYVLVGVLAVVAAAIVNTIPFVAFTATLPQVTTAGR